MFESYEKSPREQGDENDQEELMFPFNEEEEPKNSKINGYGSNSTNTYILKRGEEPPIDDFSQGLHPTPPDLQICNTLVLYECPTKVALKFHKELLVNDEVFEIFLGIIIKNVKYLGEG